MRSIPYDYSNDPNLHHLQLFDVLLSLRAGPLQGSGRELLPLQQLGQGFQILTAETVRLRAGGGLHLFQLTIV
jgi:hypothetical protein